MLVVALSLATAAAVPAAEAPVSTAAQEQRLSAIDVFALADTAQAEGRVEDALVYYDALEQDDDAEIRAEARFRKGMMLAGQRRYRDAAIAFRTLLDEKPDAVVPRLELARMLAALGDEAAARRELRQVTAASLPPEARLTVEQFARAIRSTNRAGGSLEVALAPDSNINRATRSRTVDTIIAPLELSDDARETSGLGLRVGGNAFVRIGLTDDLSLMPRVAANASLFRADSFNDIGASALMNLEWRTGGGRISPGIGRTWRWYGGQLHATTNTFTLDWLRPISPRSQLVATASAGQARYRANRLQDGGLYDLALAYEHAIDLRTGFSITGVGARQTARDPGYATWAGGLNLLGWREISGGTTLFLSTALRRTIADDRLFLFPERRQEWLLAARSGATLRRLSVNGFAPIVRVGFERNFSTIEIYDYSRLSADFGITRAF